MSEPMKKILDLAQQCHVLEIPDGTFAVFLITDGFPTKASAQVFMHVLKTSSMLDEYGRLMKASLVVTKDIVDPK